MQLKKGEQMFCKTTWQICFILIKFWSSDSEIDLSLRMLYCNNVHNT